MTIRLKKLIISLAIPLGVGIIAGLISRGSMEAFEELTKPPLSPPGWLFPVVWTILYILMGLSFYLVWESSASAEMKSKAFKPYIAQLFFNFFWTIIFFNLELYWVAFAWLVILWLLIIITAIRFYGISKVSALLMLPYILWVTFAGYLNFSIAMLN